jgi:hypothetical protein
VAEWSKAAVLKTAVKHAFFAIIIGFSVIAGANRNQEIYLAE